MIHQQGWIGSFWRGRPRIGVGTKNVDLGYKYDMMTANLTDDVAINKAEQRKKANAARRGD